MYVITVYSAKGGVGKTTTSVNLAAALAHCGKKTCLVDGDWQGNSTLWLGLNPRDEQQYAVSDLIMAGIQAPDKVDEMLQLCVRYIEEENLYVIPSNPFMNNQEFQMHINLPENRYILKDILEQTDFDYVIIDTPAVVNGFLNLAMMASDSVVVPALTDFASYDSLESTFNAIDAIQEAFNPELNIVGVLLNKTRKSNRSIAYADMIKEYADGRDIYVFETDIPYRDVIEDGMAEQETIFRKQRSNAKDKYLALVNEIVVHIEGNEEGLIYIEETEGVE